MKSKTDNNVLVILGGWNANILLNVDWLKRYLFPNNENFKVEMPIRPAIFGPPQISTDFVKLSLIGAKLSFTPLSQENSVLEEIENLGKKIADFLPHTPVSAMGINFLFEEDEEDANLSCMSVELIEKLQPFGTLKGQLHRYSFSFANHTLNLTIRKASEEIQTYDFNFNHPIQTLSDIKEIFANKTIIEYRNEARDKLSELIENVVEQGLENE